MKEYIKHTISGLGNLLVLFPAAGEEITIDSRSDCEKLRTDWEQVGSDLLNASKSVHGKFKEAE